MNEQLDLSIRKKEAELQPFLSSMEQLRLQFVNDTTRFATEWFEEKAREYATKKPEITISLGNEQLAKMKAQVSNLAKNADRIVSDALRRPEFWWHLTPHVNAPVAAYEHLGNDKVGNKFPEVLDKPVRRALGELGNILEQFGYGVTTGALRASYPEFWFECTEDSGSSVRPYFPHLFEWSEEMQYIIVKYDGLYKNAIVLFEEITMLKEEKKKQEAKALWESA